MTAPAPTMVDVAFPLAGTTLPRDHRRLLADALDASLPWLAATPGAGVHRIKVVEGDAATALVSRRSRLVVRAPRARAGVLGALAGEALAVGGHRVRLGAPDVRELLAHRTLYAEFVVAPADDELAFLEGVERELAALGVTCGRVCGRPRAIDGGSGPLAGFSLMLDALSPADSMRILEQGIGAHRRLGCGLFVPHRSAAAVGA
ncbi:MAG TPA: type I-MYXAN CRISPR-associated protein Cas6/Cmx6 [Albitalea sp.]